MSKIRWLYVFSLWSDSIGGVWEKFHGKTWSQKVGRGASFSFVTSLSIKWATASSKGTAFMVLLRRTKFYLLKCPSPPCCASGVDEPLTHGVLEPCSSHFQTTADRTLWNYPFSDWKALSTVVKTMWSIISMIWFLILCLPHCSCPLSPAYVVYFKNPDSWIAIYKTFHLWVVSSNLIMIDFDMFLSVCHLAYATWGFLSLSWLYV